MSGGNFSNAVSGGINGAVNGAMGTNNQSTPGYTIPAGFDSGAGRPPGIPMSASWFGSIAGAQPPMYQTNDMPSLKDRSLQPLQMYQQYQQGTPINQLNNPTTPRPAQYLPSQYIGGTPAPGAK